MQFDELQKFDQLLTLQLSLSKVSKRGYATIRHLSQT
jgi:hypothetical protein